MRGLFEREQAKNKAAKEKAEKEKAAREQSQLVNDNNGAQQQKKQGVKRSFEEYYAPMPDDEKYEEVSTQDAARFFNGGFEGVKKDVEALMDVQFFKIKNGNGQVFYMRKDKNGKSRIAKLHQKNRPTGYDTDDDVDDEGFQDQMNRDPFFQDRQGRQGAPPKKRKKVSIGHMVRYIYYVFFLSFVCVRACN